MDTPTYSLQHNNGQVEASKKNTYKKSQLVDMTTFQLKEICIKEKIIKGIANTLDRNELINTILRFRGEEENLFIREVVEGGFERMEETLKRKLGSRKKGEEVIKNPAKMVLYRGLDLTQYDGYQVRFVPETEENYRLLGRENKKINLGEVAKELANTNVFLVGENHKLCSILNLTTDGNDPEHYFLTRNACQDIVTDKGRIYSLLFFPKQESEYLYHNYYDAKEAHTILNYYEVPLAELEIREVEETDTVLSIDFGTTNTTAAAYLGHNYIKEPDRSDVINNRIKLGEINVVHFLDETKARTTWKPLLPTLVSVADCADPKVIAYHFGYQAMKDTKVKFHDESFSVFYEMKRWVETYTTEQEIIDKAGNFTLVKRQEMIRKYLLYVIAGAEQRFKCRFKKLHLTSPVKLKEQFNHMFQEILPEYEINSVPMLDEGTAVLYNTISNLLEKKTYYDGERMSALIMDCGGGTTDLSSCEFTIRNQNASYRIDIETTYENGDTNFGGNNITYRIMEYLKVVFADYYGKKQGIRMEDFIEETDLDIYRMVDKYGRDTVYGKLDQAYEEAENFIPTRFRNYESRSRDEYYMVKNNFYFLFQIAEQLKKKFYESKGILRNCFHGDATGQGNNQKWGQYAKSNVGQYANAPVGQNTNAYLGQYAKSNLGEYSKSNLGQYGNANDQVGVYKSEQYGSQKLAYEVNEMLGEANDTGNAYSLENGGKIGQENPQELGNDLEHRNGIEYRNGLGHGRGLGQGNGYGNLTNNSMRSNNSMRNNSMSRENSYRQEDLAITKVDTWNLVIKDGDQLKVVHDYPDIVFSITEIELLIKSDIYWIVDRFLNEFYRNRTLEQFSILKLTGQSCRIDLFREVIKEFLPGKCIEFKPFGKGEDSIRDLKLACVRGAAKYVEDQVNGCCEIHLHSTRPRIPYSISAYTHEQEEKQLIYNLEQEKIYGTISRNKNMEQLELFLRDGDSKLKHRFLYQNDSKEYTPKTYEEIRNIYLIYQEFLIQEETDTIANNEVKFFVFAAKEQWGFYLVPVTREGTQLYLGKEAFYPFENNAWEVNFFDGEK